MRMGQGQQLWRDEIVECGSVGRPRTVPHAFFAALCERWRRSARATQITPSGAVTTATSAKRLPTITSPLCALATGVTTTLCDRRRDLTIISRLPGLTSRHRRPGAADCLLSENGSPADSGLGARGGRAENQTCLGLRQSHAPCLLPAGPGRASGC